MGKIKKVYLAGSIEFSKDGGNGWRDKIKPVLQELGWEVYDPTDKEDTKEIQETLKKCKEHGLWDKFQEIVTDIQKKDKDMVLGCSLIIVLWDTETKMYGTSDEIRWALDNKIPIYTIINGPISNESSWAICKLRQTKIFDSFHKLIECMKENK